MRWAPTLKRRWLVPVLLILGGICSGVVAHEIPDDVVVQLRVVPEDQAVRVVIRVPLAAMRDFDFALRGPGYLDLARVEPQLTDAARLWLMNDLILFADGKPLGGPYGQGRHKAHPFPGCTALGDQP